MPAKHKPILLRDALIYEVRSRVWVSFISAEWLQDVVAYWLAKKVTHKWKRYKKNLEEICDGI